MEPFSRDLPGPMGCGPPQALPSSSYRPQSSDNFARPQREPLRSRPATPPTSLSVPVLPGQQPIDPARKITPPEETEIHARDEPPAVATEYKSPYDKAFAYIQEYRAWRNPRSTPPSERHYSLEDYEKALAIKMSIKDWINLRHSLELDSEDNSFPRFSFNALTSTLVIQCMPSPIYQSITRVLNEQIIRSTANVPANLRQVGVFFDEDFVSFGGRWSDSNKQPDLGIQVRNADNTRELKWVLEVGFTETYEQLKSDIQLWLEGSYQVSMVTIVKFCETPPYRCRLPKDTIYNDNGEELDTLEATGIPSDRRDILAKDITIEREYGPATYKGFQWVGEISEVWMETWVRDTDGRAVQRGNAENLMQVNQVQLDGRDFLPPGYPQTIIIDLEDFRLSLPDCIREMAVVRCANVVKDYLRRHGEGRDNGDYEP